MTGAERPNGIVRGGLRVRDLATGRASTLGPMERLVALAIGHYMRHNLTAWPSARALADWTGLSESGVRKVLKKLCGPQGLFVRVRRPGRYEGYEYSVRQGVTVGESDRGRLSPESASLAPCPARVLPRPARVSPGVNRMSQGMSEGMGTGSEGPPGASVWIAGQEAALPTESPEAAERWAPVRDAVKEGGSSSVQAFAMSARAVGLQGNRLTLWVPSDGMAKLLHAPAKRAAEAFGLVVVVVTRPLAPNVAA